MGALLQDIRYAARSFVRTPGFSLIVIAIVALGVGATTAIFSVVDCVLLRDLPYPDPDELVFFANPAHSIPLFKDWRDRTSSFKEIAASWDVSGDLTRDGPPTTIGAAFVTPGYFPIFRLVPHRGRLFTNEDFLGGEPRVGVISHRLWRTRWGGEDSTVGSTITLNGHPITVVGVLPPRFEPPGAMADSDCDLWLPLDVSSRALPFLLPTVQAQSRGLLILSVVARLRPGVTLETAQAELDALSASLAGEYPEAHRLPEGAPRRYRLISLLEATVGDLRQPLWLVMGAVCFLLLIGCANVANLFLARGTDRQHEVTLRLAFGAGYGRLTRLLLTESILISLIGGALGVGLAYHGVELLKWLSPAAAPRMEAVVLDQRVLWFALSISVATGALFGMAPALQAARTSASNVLKDAGATATSSRGRQRLRDALVVSEIVVALVLLAGAGLLFNSFIRLLSVDPGIDPEHLTVVPLELGPGYSAEDRLRFARDLSERIEAIPGVEGVAAGVTIPFSGREGRMCCRLSPVRRDPQMEEEAPEAIVHPVRTGYFEVLGTRMIRGREFTPADGDPGGDAAIMSVALARHLFGEEDAVGRSFYVNEDRLTVVGIVENIRHWGLRYDQKDVRSFNIYVPYVRSEGFYPYFQIAVRSPLDPSVLAAALRQAVWEIEPLLPVDEVVSMDDLIRRSVAQPRFLTALLTVFGSVACLLAAGGIYGSMLFSVRRRRREIGIRVALGATQADTVAMIVRHGMTLTAMGIALGIAGALALSRTMRGLVFGITTYDASTYAAACLILGLVAFVACYVPAWRAALADPMAVLRRE